MFVPEHMKKENTWSFKKLWISSMHVRLCLPSCLSHWSVLPLHLHWRNFFGPKLSNLPIQNSYRLLLKCLVWTQLHRIKWNHMRFIRNILPKHRDMENRMNCRQTRWQGQLIGHLSHSAQNLKRSNESRAKLPFFPNLITPFMGDTWYAQTYFSNKK